MTFIPIHRPSNLLDVHLTTTDKEIHNLIDEILDEIIIIKEITNRSRSRECLKKVVLNLIHTEKTGGSVSISRTKNDYSLHRMYGQIWFKYDRLIPIIDGLIELGYVEFLNGFWEKENKRGRRSKIWASEKFRTRLRQCQYKDIQRTAPEQIIHLKDADKKTGENLLGQTQGKYAKPPGTIQSIYPRTAHHGKSHRTSLDRQ
jgi:hypothetical protein